MIAINPEENSQVIKTAYYRISKEFRDFLLLCDKTYGVVGFEYDFEDGDLNFGIVCKEHKKEE